MPAIMDRIRLTFDVPDSVRRALNINGARTNRSVGEVIEWMAEQLIADDIDLANRSISEGVPAAGPKRGRKPKSSE